MMAKTTAKKETEQTEQLDLFEQLQNFIKNSKDTDKIKTLIELAEQRESEIEREKEERLLDSARDFLETIEAESVSKVLIYLLEKSGESSNIIRTYLLQNPEIKDSISDLFKSKEKRETRTKWVSPDGTTEYIRGKGEKPKDFDKGSWRQERI